MIDWHRLFGLTLVEFFSNSPFLVELEKDLSIKQQFLDLVILRKRSGKFRGVLPDGLDDLCVHNLLTYKSLRESFDDWTLDELIGHYVNYRKQSSSSRKKLLPKNKFRLYGVCTRFPRKLTKQARLSKILPGVYEVFWGFHPVRIISFK